MTAVLEREILALVEPTDSPLAHEPQDGLRSKKSKNYLVAAEWGIAVALSASVMSVIFLPVQHLPLAFLLGAGLGALGYLNHATMVRNQHIALFGTAAAILVAATQMLNGGSVLLSASLSAAGAFMLMLILTRFSGLRGSTSYLALAPAALLGAISPFAVLLWIPLTFIAYLAGMMIGRFSGKKYSQAMGPNLAIGAVLALGAYGLLAPVLGI